MEITSLHVCTSPARHTGPVTGWPKRVPQPQLLSLLSIHCGLWSHYSLLVFQSICKYLLRRHCAGLGVNTVKKSPCLHCASSLVGKGDITRLMLTYAVSDLSLCLWYPFLCSTLSSKPNHQGPNHMTTFVTPFPVNGRAATSSSWSQSSLITSPSLLCYLLCCIRMLCLSPLLILVFCGRHLNTLLPLILKTTR